MKSQQTLLFCVISLLYRVSHKVEINERFKSHKLEFVDQTSHLKHVEKLMNENLMERTLTVK